MFFRGIAKWLLLGMSPGQPFAKVYLLQIFVEGIGNPQANSSNIKEKSIKQLGSYKTTRGSAPNITLDTDPIILFNCFYNFRDLFY
jgi:hypothetical protein